jgi:integrase
MRSDVTISKVKHPRYSYRVRFPGPQGETLQSWFTTKTKAGTFAKERRKEIGREGLAFGVIGDDEKAAVQYWRTFSASVPDAPPPALLTILQDYAKQWTASRSGVTVAAAVEMYEAAKTADGLRPISLQAIRTRCGRFAKDFGSRPISSITKADVSAWIRNLTATRQPKAATPKPKAGKAAAPVQVGLRTRRNHQLALSGLFNFAEAQGWVKEIPLTKKSTVKVQKSRPGILRPGEVARLFGALEKAAPALIPFWGVRFFAGIREQETLRMDWSMIDLAAGEINLHDTVTKTGQSRTVKIQPVLAAFLAPYAQPDGPIVTRSEMARRYHLAKATAILQAEDEAAKESGEEVRPFPLPMPGNAARHSFATFHLMAFRHAGETALQLGHGGSPEMLHRHYKGICSETEALAFWEIRPAAGPPNVIPIDQQAEAAPEQPKRRNAAR